MKSIRITEMRDMKEIRVIASLAVGGTVIVPSVYGRTLPDSRPNMVLILVDDTERSVDDGSACLDGGFFLYGHGADGPRRADLRTGGAVGPAKAVLERHDRLQHRQTAVSGAQHMIGAGGNAELTAGAMAAEMILADSSRRQDGNGAFGPLPGRQLLSGDLLAVR